jgi:membrane protein
MISRSWWIFRRALVASYEDGCFGIAKGVAYSALLAFIPILTSITALLAQANAQAVSQVLSRLVFEIVPPGSEVAVMRSFASRGQRPAWLLVAAGLLSALAASGAMTSLMEGFRAAYRIPKGHTFLKERLVALLMVVGAALPVLAASSLILLGGRVEQWVLIRLGLIVGGEQLWAPVSYLSRAGGFLIAFGATTLVTAMLYRFGPNLPARRAGVWPGALVATVLWFLATEAFAWYVRNIANYNVLYGSIGAAIALLVWMYVLAVVALIGCEINAQRERLLHALGR